MKHLRALGAVPARAQTTLCGTITNDFQAQLCFLLQVLTSFFLPVITLKEPVDPDTTG